jgi:hypothetical protein
VAAIARLALEPGLRFGPQDILDVRLRLGIGASLAKGPVEARYSRLDGELSLLCGADFSL